MQGPSTTARWIVLPAACVLSSSLLIGCGGSDSAKSGKLVETPPEIIQSNNAMENFMKDQGKTAPAK